MASIPKQRITENMTKILSWSPKSNKLFRVQDLVDWSIEVPNCSTFRVNTLEYTTEEAIALINQELSKKLKSECIRAPNVRSHSIISECLIIDKVKEDDLDLTRKPNEVIIDPICGAAVLRGSDIFAPGVMGMLPAADIGSEVSVYADTSMKCLKGYKRRYEDEGKLFVGNGVVLMNRTELFDGNKRPRGVAVKMKYPTSGIVTIDHPPNLGILQNLPSIVCVRVLDPKPGDIVLDMCAAPGNKTTHIGALMKDEGCLVALDNKQTKLAQLVANCSNLGLTKCVKIFEADSRNIVGECGRAVINGPPFPPNTFDKILLDAACSGLGIRPMLQTFVESKSTADSFRKMQKQFIDNAVPLLKPGGILVYSTCSILCEENECNVAWTLQKYPEMTLLSAEPAIGDPGLPQCGLTEEERYLVQRFGLGDKQNSIGFFIAKLMKIIP